MFFIKIANGWIGTRVPWFRKGPLLSSSVVIKQFLQVQRPRFERRNFVQIVIKCFCFRAYLSNIIDILHKRDSFSFLQLFSVFHDQTQIPDAPASTRDRSQVQMPPMRSSISSSWISCKVNITRTNSRAMELYGNSGRWRLYLPKRTAVVFMFYPHKLWSTNVVLLRYTCLTVGPIQLFISIC